MDNVINIQMYGDWKAAEKAWNGLANFKRPLIKDAAKGVRVFAKKYKSLLIAGIETEGSAVGQTWVKHSEKYSKFKLQQFGNTRIMYASGAYSQELRRLNIKEKRHYVELKFRRGAKNRKAWSKGINLGRYMVIMENGYGLIPARPLWAPAYRKLGGNKGLVKEILNKVGKRLRRYNIHISTQS